MAPQAPPPAPPDTQTPAGGSPVLAERAERGKTQGAGGRPLGRPWTPGQRGRGTVACPRPSLALAVAGMCAQGTGGTRGEAQAQTQVGGSQRARSPSAGPLTGRPSLRHMTSRQPWQSLELGLHNCPPCPRLPGRQARLDRVGAGPGPPALVTAGKPLPRGQPLRPQAGVGRGSAPGPMSKGLLWGRPPVPSTE